MFKTLCKRGISALLVLVMVLSFVPYSAFAAEEDTAISQMEDFRERLKKAIQTKQAEEPAEEETVPDVPAVIDEPEYPNTPDDGHSHSAVSSERIPALCGDAGMTAGTYCYYCGVTLSGREVIPALGHDIVQHEAKLPTFTKPGWEAYEDCSRCGYTTYVEIPQLETPSISDYEMFVTCLMFLEEMANQYVMMNPGKDPVDLVIKYIRTGVDRYNSGSWGIMAGYEDAGFANFVAEFEDQLNSQVGSVEEMFCIASLKNIENFYLPNGDYVDIGHMFGTMDITYHNNFGTNHADVGGWSGDLVDLLEFSDYSGVSGTLDEMIAQINEKTFLKTAPEEVGGFNQQDMFGDLDALYLMQQLQKEGYHYEAQVSGLTVNVMMYLGGELTMETRAAYFLNNRLGGVSTRGEVRDAVYNAYTTNKVIATLEGTREFKSEDLDTLRKAVCYAYADYICKLAGDYVEDTSNDLYTVFSTETATLAPGVTQQIKMATTADGHQIVFYLATADINREDVHIYANYHNNDPSQGWAMQRVLDQANAAQDRHSDPTTEHYIENYNVVAAVNGSGFNMTTGQPSGLLIMEGVEYSPVNHDGFFGILKDGTPVIATTQEYNTIYKGNVQEAIAGFGAKLIEDGKIIEGLTDERASRTAVGITKTGKVVFMVLDGRQIPFSAGGGYATLAQILLEAGCVEAINLDGGGSTTFVGKQPGDEELSVVNRPSDGFARSVSTSWIIVSTAPSSTAFDHAVIESEYDYLSAGASVQLSAAGVSPSGNAVDLPEGAYWAVADSGFGTITEDGVFTALKYGEAEVYLMLEDAVVGSKTLQIVVPDNLYYTKTNLDTVFGQTCPLPLKAVYQGKEMAFTANDVSFTLSNTKGGYVDGVSFVVTGNENCGVSNVNVTAALVANPAATAVIKVSLYKQGELSFDFDQATGGDRQLAWQREVFNTTTDDGSVYILKDPSQDMVTSYILAIDMTQIPIPARLEELTYMLPGSDIEGANAWTFLCQLAERISPLTEITAVVHYDPNLTIDVSQMKLINDYFILTNTEVDEENSTLTLTLKWKKQTQAINVDTANALCLVNGIFLTPKADAQWDSKNQLNIVNSGDVSYKIYMRASALYSFSGKPENQEIYGLYSYINPADSYDKGGYFCDTYQEFDDSYTLVNQIKEGWYIEDGGITYYVAGVRCTGVKAVEGLYYNFGENGVLAAKTPYTGLFREDGKTYYAKNGETVIGWHNIGQDWYLFDWHTGAGEEGTYKTTIDGVEVTYEFDGGKLLKGYWYRNENGLQYFYGPYYYKQGWKTIDGEQYFFSEYYAATGVYPVRAAHAVYASWCEFTQDGVYVGQAENGVYHYNGDLYYVVDGLTQFSGLYEFEGSYYYAASSGKLKRSCSEWLSITRGIIPAGTYRMDENGKVIMTTELVDENGTLYYYLNGKRTANVGMVSHNGSIYLIGEGAIAVTNATRWVSKTNGLKPVGVYTFDAEGKLVTYNGIVDGYYYVDGIKTAAGMLHIDGDYYFAGSGGKLRTNETVWCSNNNGLLPAGTYRFGADGKVLMESELVDENGTLYYYENGRRLNMAGLVHFGGSYYYVVSGAIAVKSSSVYVTKHNNLLPEGTYRFDADGKAILTTEIVNENGKLYYYENGRRINKAGLIQLNGHIYYVGDGAIAATNTTIYITKTNGLRSEGYYTFDAEGKLVIYNGIVDGYYYVDGIKTAAGMLHIDGNYYFAAYGGKLKTNETVWCQNNNGLLPDGTYRFDADGKVIMTTEIANENGTLYYYENGRRINMAGLVQFGGSYYYVVSGAIAVTNSSVYITKHNGLLPVGTYRFDAQGKAILTTEIVNENGTLYYYENGRRLNMAGLVALNGSIYYVGEGAIAATNTTIYVSKTNGLRSEGYYTFDADGKMVIYNGVVDGYYYVDGIKTAAGMLYVDGNYYFAAYGGKLKTSSSSWCGNNNGLLPDGTYRFDADGKVIMTTEIVNENGTLYYYRDGRRINMAGLVQFGGSYYYVASGAIAATNSSVYVDKTNGLLPAGTYRFDAQGKAILTTEIVNENGTLYYYRDGRRINMAGMVELDGSIYYVGEGAIVATSATVYVAKTNGLRSEGYYTFDAEGKLV